MPQPEREPRLPDYRASLKAYDVARQRYLDRPTPHHLALLTAGEAVLYRELLQPGRFELGTQVMTPGAHEAMELAVQIPPEFLLRHKRGDWGELDPEDKQANEWALRWEELEAAGQPVAGAIPGWLLSKRLLSAYATRTGERLWVITEHDRSATTILLPSEY